MSNIEKRELDWFPIMGRRPIPMGMIAPHEAQALDNHDGQDLVRLAERGGLDPTEALAVLEDRPWRLMDADEAWQAIHRMENSYKRKEHEHYKLKR